MTREALIRDLMAVPEPSALGYEARFVSVCCRWPDVALPAAVAREVVRDDFHCTEPCELTTWLLARWKANQPMLGAFEWFMAERNVEREEVDSWWQFRDLWMHFGDCWYPDQWCAGEYWPEVTTTLTDLLLDKILMNAFKRRFGIATKRIERALELSHDPRQAVASLLLEYRRAARRVRPHILKPHPITARDRRRERDERLAGL